MKNIIPQIDLDKIQEKANEAANKAYVSSIDEFYNGYNSPYKKAIEEQLKEKCTSVHLDIPDIVGLLNDGISKEFDLIANKAVSKSFIPLATKLLTRSEKNITITDIMKSFVEHTDFEYLNDNIEDYQIEINSSYEDGGLKNCFFDIEIENNDTKFHIHCSNENRNRGDNEEVILKVLSLPRDENNRLRTDKKMTLSLDGGKTLEMPFTTSILHCGFTAYIASLVINQSLIKIDSKYFTEEMFPERGCHC